MWWPSPESLDDLSVNETTEGWQLSAPDNTELAEWLNYWSQDEEHRKFFNEAFVAALLRHLESKNGKDEELPDGRQQDRIQAQDDEPGTQSEHESSSNP